MEEMKKFISFLLMIIMVFSMAVSVFATSGTNDDTGKITINNAVEGETYKVYWAHSPPLPLLLRPSAYCFHWGLHRRF